MSKTKYGYEYDYFDTYLPIELIFYDMFWLMMILMMRM